MVGSTLSSIFKVESVPAVNVTTLLAPQKSVINGQLRIATSGVFQNLEESPFFDLSFVIISLPFTDFSTGSQLFVLSTLSGRQHIIGGAVADYQLSIKMFQLSFTTLFL
jgi:hypothetical protein